MYEYKVCQVSKGDVEKELNRLAKYGWRLISINQEQDSVRTNYAGIKPLGVSGGGSSNVLALFFERKISDVTEEIRQAEIEEEASIVEINRLTEEENTEAGKRGCWTFLLILTIIILFIFVVILVTEILFG